MRKTLLRAVSSSGRALALQARCDRFKSGTVHFFKRDFMMQEIIKMLKASHIDVELVTEDPETEALKKEMNIQDDPNVIELLIRTKQAAEHIKVDFKL